MEAWRILPFRKAGAAENMAVDEAIFQETVRQKTPPTLRFYGWQAPALSIGYFQDYEKEVDEEACRRFGVEIVRRPTGGKAVLHEQELTYAVIAGDDPLFPPDIPGTYRLISRCIARGLREIGIRAEMETAGRPVPDGALRSSCFSFPSHHELCVAGRKICGSAQMRSHGFFLQHGSLLLAFDPLRTCAVMLPHREPEQDADRLRNAVTSVWEEAKSPIDEAGLSVALRKGFEEVLGIRFWEGDLTPDEKRLADELIAKKYGGGSWNREGRRRE